MKQMNEGTYVLEGGGVGMMVRGMARDMGCGWGMKWGRRRAGFGRVWSGGIVRLGEGVLMGYALVVLTDGMGWFV